MNLPASLSIRELSGLGELEQTPPLARAVWGEGDQPEDPSLLLAVQHIGGLVAGAVDGEGQMWAYLVGLPTSQADTQHSHRLGVHPGVRKQHLGERLKRFQREWCLDARHQAGSLDLRPPAAGQRPPQHSPAGRGGANLPAQLLRRDGRHQRGRTFRPVRGRVALRK